MVQTGHNAYAQNAGNAIISQELLLMKLLEGSLKFLHIAKRGMEEKNPKIKGENISKVMAIVSELDCALNFDAGGEMARNLATLYQHINYRLVNANINNDIYGIDEVEHILKEIKEGFEQVIKINKENKINQQPSQPMIDEPREGFRLAI